MKVEMNKKFFAAAAALSASVIALTGCSSDADVVSKNLSKESDQFKIDRRVVFFNGITDKYLLSIEGKCSINDDGNQLEVTCKTGEDEYKKHFLGLSDNVSYFVEQLESAEVSRYHYKVIFKPETIIADVDRP
ncbi:hypothetical protein ACFVVM_06400 [Nocardia sp. NPDC058176]|uniref:beta-sandwich lipoprotein n=1 Tax=Nocardia sp. NPDC058176 TaxID=3346368 RepID=UPI0036DE4942